MKLYKIPHYARIPILNKIEKEAIFYNNFQDYLVSNQEIQFNNRKFYCNLYHNIILENINFKKNDFDSEYLEDANHYLITIQDIENNFYQIDFIDNIFSNYSLKSAFILNNFTKPMIASNKAILAYNNFSQNQEFLLAGLMSAISNIITENISFKCNNHFNKEKMSVIFNQNKKLSEAISPIIEYEKQTKLFRLSCMGRYEPYYDDYYGIKTTRKINIGELFESCIDSLHFNEKYSFNIKSPINNNLPNVSIKPDKQEKILLTQKNESANITTFY